MAGGRKMFRVSRRILVLVICIIIGIIAIERRDKPAVAADSLAAQDISSLDRRINSVEQRIYSIESSINQLRQQMIDARRSSSSLSSDNRDPETERLRLEVDMLQRRIVEIECGLVKLDQRTLPESARTASKGAAAAKDPCRQQPNTPVQLSSRQ